MTTKTDQTPAKSKTKYIIIAILVLLAVAAVIFVPKYNRHLKDTRAAEIKTALEQFRASIDTQWKTSGSISGITVEGALQDAGIKASVLRKWNFVVAWKLSDIYTTQMVDKLKDVSTNEMAYVSPYRLVLAVATRDNPLGEGTKLWFNGDTNSYHGFGVDQQVEPDWSTVFPNP